MTCLAQVKRLTTSLFMLAVDNDDVFKVTVANWQTQVRPYTKNERLYHCPLDKGGGGSYSINPNLAGTNETSVREPAKTVLLYEGRNSKLEFRHNGRAVVAFADGMAKLVTPEEAKALNWKP